MAFRLKTPDGIEIEVDTGDEFAQVLTSVRAGRNGSVVREQNGNGNSQPQAPNRQYKLPPDPVAAFEAFRTRVQSPKQRDLIRTLFNEKDWIADDVVRSHLGYKTNTQLAGLLCAITRHAKAVGIDQPVVEKNADGAKIKYRLSQFTRDYWA
jgi:hypothetical protein